MATLSLTHTYVAGTLAKASEVNSNFSDIVTWSQGNIQNDNIGTLSGLVSWSISTGVAAISVTNSGSEGSVYITQSANLSSSKAVFRLTNTAAATSGDGGLHVNFSNASATIPALLVSYKGFTNFGVYPDVVSLPRRTTAERNAVSSAPNGSVLYNTTTKTHETYTGERWTVLGVPPGAMLPFAGTSAPAGYLGCDGAAVSRTNYAALFLAIGTTWGVGDGSTTFNVPDMRRRAAIGSGGTQIQGPATAVGNVGGVEEQSLTTAQLASHSHTGTTGINSASHTHNGSIAGGGVHSHRIYQGTLGAGANTVISTGLSGAPSYDQDNNVGLDWVEDSTSHTHSITIGTQSSNHTHDITTATAGSGSAHNNMQPSAVVLYIIKT